MQLQVSSSIFNQPKHLSLWGGFKKICNCINGAVTLSNPEFLGSVQAKAMEFQFYLGCGEMGLEERRHNPRQRNWRKWGFPPTPPPPPPPVDHAQLAWVRHSSLRTWDVSPDLCKLPPLCACWTGARRVFLPCLPSLWLDLQPWKPRTGAQGEEWNMLKASL